MTRHQMRLRFGPAVHEQGPARHRVPRARTPAGSLDRRTSGVTNRDGSRFGSISPSGHVAESVAPPPAMRRQWWGHRGVIRRCDVTCTIVGFIRPRPRHGRSGTRRRCGTTLEGRTLGSRAPPPVRSERGSTSSRRSPPTPETGSGPDGYGLSETVASPPRPRGSLHEGPRGVILMVVPGGTVVPGDTARWPGGAHDRGERVIGEQRQPFFTSMQKAGDGHPARSGFGREHEVVGRRAGGRHADVLRFRLRSGRRPHPLRGPRRIRSHLRPDTR